MCRTANSWMLNRLELHVLRCLENKLCMSVCRRPRWRVLVATHSQLLRADVALLLGLQSWLCWLRCCVSVARTHIHSQAGRHAANQLFKNAQLAVAHTRLAVTCHGPLLRVGAGCCVLGRCLFIGRLACLVLCSLFRVALSWGLRRGMWWVLRLPDRRRGGLHH